MRISIFGLGYVGCVSAACLAKAGHDVVGVDVNAEKVKILSGGRSPVVEKDLDGLISEAVKAGTLRATTDAAKAVAATGLSLVCVGTPSNANSSLNLDYVARVCESIGAEVAKKREPHVVCVRSTMVPGSTEEVVMPSLAKGFGEPLEKSDLLRVVVNPEFLREGSAVADFFDPPKTVVGAADEAVADVVMSLYDGIAAPAFKTSIKTAEMVKYVDNTFHALKIAFANEVGTIARAVGVDSHEVMDIFCRDRKLNISSAYLKPGFAFGGSCLPKDLRAILYRARTLDLDLPLLSSILPGNEAQLQRAVDMVFAQGKKRLGFLGMSFKAGTDDLRESPLVRLIEACIGRGYDIRIFDRNVSLARLVGANKAYIEHEIPHISRLLSTDLDEVTAFAEVLVVGHKSDEFAEVVAKVAPGTVVIDLARVVETPPRRVDYIGFNW
jgi:GDP-mannose 6-dehydrogenase